MLVPILKFSRHLWHLFAISVLITALLGATARWLLLHIDDHSAWVETWLSRTLERPVDIGELRGHWRGWSPSIQIDGLTIYEQGSGKTLIRFENAQVELSIYESLKNKDLQPDRIILSGVKFSLERDANGKFSISGMPPSRWPVAQWIEAQSHFNLTNAHIEFIDLKSGGETHVFKDLKIYLRRDGDTRYITATTTREAQRSETWHINILADNSILESDWNGNLNVQASNIHTSVINTVVGNPKLSLIDGQIKLSVESQWRGAKLRDANFSTELFTNNQQSFSSETRSASSPPQLRALVEGSSSRIDDGWSIGTRILQLDKRVFKQHIPTISARWHKRS